MWKLKNKMSQPMKQNENRLRGQMGDCQKRGSGGGAKYVKRVKRHKSLVIK